MTFARIGSIIERRFARGRDVAVCIRCGTRYFVDRRPDVPAGGLLCVQGWPGPECRGQVVTVRGNGGE